MRVEHAVRALLVIAAASLARGELLEFHFVLEGAQEVPPNRSNAWGAAALWYDTGTQRFDLDLMVCGIDLADLADVGPNPSPVHIHLAPPGANGPIQVDVGFLDALEQDGLGIRIEIQDVLFGGQQGGVFSDPEVNGDALLAGNLYLNAHTQTFPAGDIRGQNVPEPGALAVLTASAAIARR